MGVKRMFMDKVQKISPFIANSSQKGYFEFKV